VTRVQPLPDPSGFCQVEILVSDLERAVAFQERALGAVRARQGRGSATAVTRVGHTCFLLIETAGAEPRGPLRADAPGAYHVCVSVPDLRAAHARLRAAGVETSTPPAELLPGLWSVYLRDPDGVHYQLLQVPGESAIHHVAVNVADLDRAIDWYERQLDAAVVHRGSASGGLSSRLLEVPDASYDVALLSLRGVLLELMQWTSPPGQDAPRSEGDLGALRLSLDIAPAVSLVDPDGLRLEQAAPEDGEGGSHATPSGTRRV
jgi:catechol 2,3-dioxygenase-like lactoylglutathione lyase family enzyme